ncbi:hypothetical protein R3P38DRAFT_2904974 [Favolaschia claudopus]|uniref:F-box domain-containing protein n=1 Tax=Favolaschia claudopus TaxID=2862362 RepID=A0AAW0CJA4_9AGAR
MSSSTFKSCPGLGPLSNGVFEYQKQNTLVSDKDGRLRYTALSRRILCLPLETLAEIFERCLPDIDFVCPSPTQAPLVLCGVCHQWREVALSTPTLWCSLEINLSLSGEACWDAYAYICLTWLSRIRKASLSISILLSRPLKWPERVRPLLEAIAGMSAQWRVIKFNPALVDPQLLFPKTASAPLHFPFLEKVVCTNNTQFNDLLPFTNAPRLRELCTFSSIALPEDFPWAQLAAFSARAASLSSSFAVLDRAVDLVKLHLRIGVDDVSSIPTSIVSLDSLQHLSITALAVAEDMLSVTPMSILRRLKTPTLKHLTLRHNREEEYPADYSPFFSWITRSAVQLHSLVLFHIPVSEDTLVTCLKAVPSLVELQLKPLHDINLDTLFAQLTVISFLPRLKSMLCEFSYEARSDPNILAKALRWRWDSVDIAKLHLFSILKWHSADYFQVIRAELSRLQEEGMELYFGHHPTASHHALSVLRAS